MIYKLIAFKSSYRKKKHETLAACLASVGNSKNRAKQSKHKKEYKCYIQPMGSFCLIKDLFCPTPLLSTDQYKQPPPCTIAAACRMSRAFGEKLYVNTSPK